MNIERTPPPTSLRMIGLRFILTFLLAGLTACVGRQEALDLTQQLESSGAIAKAAVEQIQDSHELTVNILKDMRGKYILADHERKTRLIDQALAEIDSLYEQQRSQMAIDYADTIRDLNALAADQLAESRKDIEQNIQLRNLERQIFAADGRAREALQLSRDRSDTEKLRAAKLSAQALGLSAEYNRIQEEAARKLYQGIYSALEETISEIGTHRSDFETALSENHRVIKATYQNVFQEYPVNIATLTNEDLIFTKIIISAPAAVDEGEGEDGGDEESKPEVKTEVVKNNTSTLASIQRVLVTDPASLGPEPRVPTEAYTALIEYHNNVINAAQGLRQNINDNSLSAILSTTTQGLLNGVQEGLTMVFSGQEIPTTTADLQASGNELLNLIKNTASETLESQKNEFKAALESQKKNFESKVANSATTVLTETINASSLSRLLGSN